MRATKKACLFFGLSKSTPNVSLAQVRLKKQLIKTTKQKRNVLDLIFNFNFPEVQ